MKKNSHFQTLREAYRERNGFTLIELLVVIAIIGLLASVVLVSLNSARSKSRDAKRLADIKQMASALELFFNDTSAYPTAAAYTAANGAKLGSVVMQAFNRTTGAVTAFTPTYVGLVPNAPTPRDGSCAATGNGGNEYFYETSSNGTAYTITFCLGQSTGSYNAGIRRLTPAGIQ